MLHKSAEFRVQNAIALTSATTTTTTMTMSTASSAFIVERILHILAMRFGFWSTHYCVCRTSVHSICTEFELRICSNAGQPRRIRYYSLRTCTLIRYALNLNQIQYLVAVRRFESRTFVIITRASWQILDRVGEMVEPDEMPAASLANAFAKCRRVLQIAAH